MNSESFEALLQSLNPDREKAASEYQHLRARLVRLFEWNNVADAAALADTAFDRLAAHLLNPEKPPVRSAPYFLQGVARNLIHEDGRRNTKEAEAARVMADLHQPYFADSDRLESALQQCLQKLPAEKRKLLKSYYLFSRGDKIRHHARTAEALGISLNTMRNRVLRIRLQLESCIRSAL